MHKKIIIHINQVVYSKSSTETWSLYMMNRFTFSASNTKYKSTWRFKAKIRSFRPCKKHLF